MVRCRWTLTLPEKGGFRADNSRMGMRRPCVRHALERAGRRNRFPNRDSGGRRTYPDLSPLLQKGLANRTVFAPYRTRRARPCLRHGAPEWGWFACSTNRYIGYTFKWFEGYLVSYAVKPIIIKKERCWIVELIILDEWNNNEPTTIFTYLTDMDIENLLDTVRQRQEPDASAATSQ